MFLLTEQPIQPPILKQSLLHHDCGGFASFEGWVRDWNEGRRVQGLLYESFEELALKEGEKVIEEARTRFPIRDVKAVHRTGHLELGEITIWIGVASRHREEAFMACRYAIDAIKARLPIWKKEFYLNGETAWVGCSHCSKLNQKNEATCTQ
jgi:molybdopterin synthase catalytic subunit